ncbi:trypsin-like peptidase domain-containing protein [Halobacillus sp. ACCC02827]|uniref:S1C family serine protease n=1 Tax=Bacillaceae TaxID=186817 RepID=UPI0004116616|nr:MULTISPECIES: trypsin-like peptidase domain-containing protein [Bacillaceae]QHT45482.1 PDZ domain-containing protein [Bacillus sp. SB49]WJE16280.1 trypsin-like peptidase domain-containing protein [Halobacillus sp. ACCC02827]
MGEKKQSLFKVIGLSLSAGVLGSALTLGITSYGDQAQDNGKDAVVESATQEAADVDVSTIASDSGKSTADIAEAASDAIVGVVNMTTQQSPFQASAETTEKGTGSGVIYKVTDDAAYIVTNNHVVEGASELKISLNDGSEVDAEVIGTDALTDIAVLKIDGDYDIKPLAFGDSDNVRAGDEVIAIGNPLGLDLSRTVTQGIISAKSRTITTSTSAGEWDLDVIQTDAAINPGNSGGALINSAGQLIGINSLKIASEEAEGLGFAIPSNDVKDLIADITDDGKVDRPYLGVGVVSIDQVPAYYTQTLPEDVKEGVIIGSIDEMSAAAKAGLKEEDVIVSIDDQQVTSSSDLRKYLYTDHKAGDKVSVKYYRDGQAQTVQVILSSQEES